MTRKTLGILALLVLNVLLHSTVVTLDLDESITLALENNKEVQGEKAAIEIANWQQRAAFSNFLPQVAFSAMMVRLDDDTFKKANELHFIPVLGSSGMPTGDFIPFSMGGMPQTSYKTGLTASQPIFVGGKIYNGFQIARYNRQLSENNSQNKQNEIRFQLATIYLNILKLQDMQELVGKSIQSAETKLKQIELQKELGMANKADYLQWQVRVKEYQKTLKGLDFNLISLIEIYNNFMGFNELLYLPQKIDYKQLEDEILDIAAMSETELENYLTGNLTKLLSDNPQLKNLELSEKMLKTNRRIAGGSFLPNLAVQFSYEFENDDKLNFSGDKNWNLAAVLSFPLFQGGKNVAEYSKANAELRRTQLLSATANEHYQRETKRLSREMTLAAMNVENMKTAFEYASENYKILNTLYEQDMATSSSLLDAEALIFSGEIELISAYYAYLTTKYELEKYITFQEIK
ncbi:MAG: TolC family protein [Candidatus Cloacimonas sp.]|nr:TolC family protein [Candidatus Cloacimonadota bacterium]